MKKKYIVIDGKKHFIKDSDIKTAEVKLKKKKTIEKKKDESLEAKVNEVTNQMIDSINKKLGLKDGHKLIDTIAEMNENLNAGNSKINKIFADADNLKINKSKLTKEEKIVGFYQALITGNKTVAKALSEGTNADGGFLVPDEFRGEIIRWLADENRMRSIVRVIPMKRRVMDIPTLVSSVKVTWTAENAAKSTTTVHFGQATLTARKVAAILYSSDELIEDATDFDMVSLIIDLFAEALAEEEDKVICAGNGTTQPTGIVTAGTIRSRAVTGNLGFDDIIDLIHDLPRKYRRNAKFLVHSDNVRNLRKLKDGNGRYLWQDPVNEQSLPKLNNYPVVEIDWVGEANIFFGDWKRAYWLGDRKKMTVKVSQDTTQAFTQDETAIRVVERLGGNVVLPDAAAQLNSIP